MYGQHATLGATAATTSGGAGLAFGVGWGWLVFAVFVLSMAAWALLTILPRRRREIGKVNPPAVRRIRLRPGS